MAVFSPYTIHHLQLDTLHEHILPAGKHYIACWFRKIPLGHCWIDVKPPQAALDSFSSDLHKQLSPALNFYLEQQSVVSFKEWDAHLAGGRYALLAKLLERVIDTASKPAAAESLSVIICTRNRPAALEKCVKALLSSSDPDFELIVVDNAPDDDQTEHILKQYPSVRYVKEERKGLDIARNTGARNARHAIIAYTDDDVTVDKDWTAHLKTAFSDRLVMAVTGMVLPEALQTRSQYIFEKYWGFNKGYIPKMFDRRYFLEHLPSGVPAWDIGAGANMAFRREIFELAGWFDERLDVGASGCSGDSEFWYRILAEGWNCLYLPHIYVYHQHRTTEAELNRQLFYYMRGHISALLVQHERYQHKGNLERIRRILPRYYWSKLKERIKGRDENSWKSFWAEISGCMSGWQFYKKVKDQRPASQPPFVGDLQQEMPVPANALVSVIIPCRNYGHYLKDAIQSALDQSYPNIEVIVVDDGSTDNTSAVCRNFQGVIYVRTEHVGVSAARNIGIQFSRGDFLVFLDADDMLYPGAAELNLYYFGVFKNAVYISGAYDRMNGRGQPLPPKEGLIKAGDNYQALLMGNYIGMPATVMYRRSLFFRFHFNTLLKYCEEYEMNLRIARYLPVFGHADKVAVYRIHSDNTSNARKEMYEAAIGVLAMQKDLLRNEEERSALNEGLQNWKEYYSN